MTTEDDFQAALDAHPDDWQTRLVFADWLDERNDPRGPGYRALGVLRLRSYRACSDAGIFHWYNEREQEKRAERSDVPSDLPGDWYEELPDSMLARMGGFKFARSRRDAEDAATFAFARLPAARRAELLAVPAPV